MGDSRRGSRLDLRGNSVGAFSIGNRSIDSLIGALTTFMEQQRLSSSGLGATNVLKGLMNKIGMFDGKDIIRF